MKLTISFMTTFVGVRHCIAEIRSYEGSTFLLFARWFVPNFFILPNMVVLVLFMVRFSVLKKISIKNIKVLGGMNSASLNHIKRAL